eukprot:33771-Eustigmatos_ZCMA.PRE.1
MSTPPSIRLSALLSMKRLAGTNPESASVIACELGSITTLRAHTCCQARKQRDGVLLHAVRDGGVRVLPYGASPHAAPLAPSVPHYHRPAYIHGGGRASD